MTGAARRAAQPHPVMEVLRYTAVVLAGLGVDVAIGYAAHQVLGLPLILGASLGFFTGVTVNYVLFEIWVFRTESLTWARLGKAYLAALGAFVMRLVSVWALSRTLTTLAPALPRVALVTLVLSAGMSFIVNFVLVRLLLKPQYYRMRY